jgi:hypothetical protein
MAMSPPSDTNLPEERMNIQWSADNETILAEWHDIAICYKYMFEKTHAYYANLNAWYTIPAIIFSTISGTASFAQASLPTDYQVYAPMAIGTVNIIIGILTTIQQYLKISELKESNKTVSLAWDKFSRNIAIELAKAPDERQDAGHFLKYSRQEFDRLMENGNTIPSHIVRKFKRKFSGKTPEEKHNYDMIKKPDVCDVLVSINAKRHMWFPKRDIHDIYSRPRGDSVYSGPHPPQVPAAGYYYDDGHDEEGGDQHHYRDRDRRRSSEDTFFNINRRTSANASISPHARTRPHHSRESSTPNHSSKDPSNSTPTHASASSVAWSTLQNIFSSSTHAETGTAPPRVAQLPVPVVPPLNLNLVPLGRQSNPGSSADSAAIARFAGDSAATSFEATRAATRSGFVSRLPPLNAENYLSEEGVTVTPQLGTAQPTQTPPETDNIPPPSNDDDDDDNGTPIPLNTAALSEPTAVHNDDIETGGHEPSGQPQNQ